MLAQAMLMAMMAMMAMMKIHALQLNFQAVDWLDNETE
jgi:acid stress-induced BolA-like protein IbaG/YrbA